MSGFGDVAALVAMATEFVAVSSLVGPASISTFTSLSSPVVDSFGITRVENGVKRIAGGTNAVVEVRSSSAVDVTVSFIFYCSVIRGCYLRACALWVLESKGFDRMLLFPFIFEGDGDEMNR